MPSKARIALLVPTHFQGEMPSSGEFIDWFKAAEELGFDSIWVLDRIFSNSKVLDAMMVMAWASGVTSRVRLGTGVLLLPYRNPILLAREVASVDYMSGGRVDLGIGLGGRESEFVAFGMQISERVKRFRDNLAAMRALWSGSNVTYEGRFHKFEGANVEPHPVQKGGIPIWIGGEAEGVLKRTAELADGWIGGAKNDPQMLGEKIGKMKDYARARGRDPESLSFGSLEYMTLDEDVDRARDHMHSLTSSIYGPSFDTGAYTTFGPPEPCTARLQAVIDAGCTEVIVCPPDLSIGQITRVAEEVVPKLKR